MKKQKRHSDRSGRVPLRSPGRPPAAQREDRRRFWAAITRDKRVRMRHLWQECRPRWGHVGSERRAACHQRGLHHRRSRLRGGTCCSRSGRRSLSCGPKGMACGRSPAAWSGPHRPSPGSCGGTRLPAEAVWTIGRRPHSGTPTARPPPAGQAGGQPGAAAVRAGSSGRHGRRPGRGGGSRAGRDVEGPPSRAPAGPTMGHGVEPGTDRSAPAARLSRGPDDAHQP